MALLLCLASAARAQCPQLSSYYPEHNPATAEDWAGKLPAIEALLESCLRSAEYFALLGAAQLNTGQVSQAMESLERALLIDPDHGAALIDYAEVLYLEGQLFPALEINARLLKRQDLPASVAPVLLARQQRWQQQTRHHQYMLETTTGYDNNLNGGPTRSDLTLTFGGTPVSFTLSPAYRPLSGNYASLRLGGAWQWQLPEHTHDLIASLRVRKTSVGDTDLAQGDWRYTYSLPVRHNQWEFSGGTSHMLFGGSPLYSVGELRARFVMGLSQCRPSVEVATQDLFYHGQTVMNGLESSLNAGYGCTFTDSQQALRLDGGVLSNKAQHSDRPGGDRTGWNVRLNWQIQRGPNELAAQLGYAYLEDQSGYSPLLENGAIRNVQNEYLNLRFKHSFKGGMALLINLSHQRQDSNLQPFQNRGTAAEVGLALNF